MNFNTIIIIVGSMVGLLCIFASVFNFDWFFNRVKTSFFYTKFGRSGVRIYYLIIGIILLALGYVTIYQR